MGVLSYSDSDRWSAPQKVQFGDIPWVPLDCRALLGSVKYIGSLVKNDESWVNVYLFGL